MIYVCRVNCLPVYVTVLRDVQVNTNSPQWAVHMFVCHTLHDNPLSQRLRFAQAVHRHNSTLSWKKSLGCSLALVRKREKPNTVEVMVASTQLSSHGDPHKARCSSVCEPSRNAIPAAAPTHAVQRRAGSAADHDLQVSRRQLRACLA